MRETEKITKQSAQHQVMFPCAETIILCVIEIWICFYVGTLGTRVQKVYQTLGKFLERAFFSRICLKNHHWRNEVSTAQDIAKKYLSPTVQCKAVN